jgi:hypothetical protein
MESYRFLCFYQTPRLFREDKNLMSFSKLCIFAA